jgi:uncharacterized protein
MIDQWIFFPRKNNTDLCEKWRATEVMLNINQQNLQGWFVKAANQEKSPVLIYYGGNAEDISYTLECLDQLTSTSLFMMNYRGFGKSSGRPSQEGLLSDALANYDHMVDVLKINPDKIYLMGRSIGSSIAAYVASKRKIGGLILVTPYDSIANLAPKFLRFFFIRKYLDRYFNTAKYLEQVEIVFLVLAAGLDEIVPRKCLENLVMMFKDQMIVIEIKNADHQNISDYPEFLVAIQNYIHDRFHN